MTLGDGQHNAKVVVMVGDDLAAAILVESVPVTTPLEPGARLVVAPSKSSYRSYVG